MSETLEATLAKHLNANMNDADYAAARTAFLSGGFALISNLLPVEVKSCVAAEADHLLNGKSVRRDIRLPETGNSRRAMVNVTADSIREHGSVVPGLYNSSCFRSALARVVGEEIYTCPYAPEEYILTHLSRSGDTHGWHWDDFSFGVILVIDCPDVEQGGFVQTVTNTRWNKKNPRVYSQMVGRPIESHALSPGDIYILRTDTTMHRVHPIEDGGRRTIINMAYAASRDLNKNISHETMEDLFS